MYEDDDSTAYDDVVDGVKIKELLNFGETNMMRTISIGIELAYYRKSLRYVVLNICAFKYFCF